MSRSVHRGLENGCAREERKDGAECNIRVAIEDARLALEYIVLKA